MRWRKIKCPLNHMPRSDGICSQNLVFPKQNDERILTLGTGKMRWRKIKCPLNHMPRSDGICIKGVVYYLAHEVSKASYEERWTYEIICFDVRSEKFKFIKAKCSFNLNTKLIEYKGKLCLIYWKYGVIDAIELWVLKDVEKREWSKYVYTLPENKVADLSYVSVVGATATGDIVFLSKYYTSSPFYVFYFNPERNTLQSVEINGFNDEIDEMSISAGVGNSIDTFLDHVEDLNVNDAKLFKSSISAPYGKYKSSIDVITKRPKPQYRHVVRERDRDRRYDGSMSREKKHRERCERDCREDEDRRRRRREEEARDRERRVESQRDRDNYWSDKEYKEKRRERDRSRGRGEMRDRERHVESRRDRDNHWSDKEYKKRRRERDSMEDEDRSSGLEEEARDREKCGESKE